MAGGVLRRVADIDHADAGQVCQTVFFLCALAPLRETLLANLLSHAKALRRKDGIDGRCGGRSIAHRARATIAARSSAGLRTAGWAALIRTRRNLRGGRGTDLFIRLAAPTSWAGRLLAVANEDLAGFVAIAADVFE